MKVLEFLIDKTGAFVYPTTISITQINSMIAAPTDNQINLIFYDDIVTNENGTITPIDPVISGLSGTVTVQARTTPDMPWSDIEDGVLDLSTGANMAFPTGQIAQVQALCATVAGCNYILVQMYRGA